MYLGVVSVNNYRGRQAAGSSAIVNNNEPALQQQVEKITTIGRAVPPSLGNLRLTIELNDGL